MTKACTFVAVLMLPLQIAGIALADSSSDAKALDGVTGGTIAWDISSVDADTLLPDIEHVGNTFVSQVG